MECPAEIQGIIGRLTPDRVKMLAAIIATTAAGWLKDQRREEGGAEKKNLPPGRKIAQVVEEKVGRCHVCGDGIKDRVKCGDGYFDLCRKGCDWADFQIILKNEFLLKE